MNTENKIKSQSEIAWQNKDIVSKYFADKFAGKSLAVYGIDLPRIEQVLPTNLPAIQANELRMDNLFMLEDGRFLLLDYESKYEDKNKLKYLSYILRILERYVSVYGMNMQIILVVIYTADVEPDNTKNILDVHSVKMKFEEKFLLEMDSDEIKNTLERKIRDNENLSDEDMMRYIILPLTYKGEDKKREVIEELFALGKEVKDESTQMFLLSGLLVFTDKVINAETAKKIKEWIRMTKVARLFEEEKIEAVNKAVNKERRTAEERVKAAEGKRIFSILSNVKSLMSKMDLSAEASMDMLSISEDDRKAIALLL